MHGSGDCRPPALLGPESLLAHGSWWQVVTWVIILNRDLMPPTSQRSLVPLSHRVPVFTWKKLHKKNPKKRHHQIAFGSYPHDLEALRRCSTNLFPSNAAGGESYKTRCSVASWRSCWWVRDFQWDTPPVDVSGWSVHSPLVGLFCTRKNCTTSLCWGIFLEAMKEWSHHEPTI